MAIWFYGILVFLTGLTVCVGMPLSCQHDSGFWFILSIIILSLGITGIFTACFAAIWLMLGVAGFGALASYFVHQRDMNHFYRDYFLKKL